ncbi:diacylglycerol lipase-alpha isoform X1 [Phlebotomus papatasi]|uniref:diacylglycerol lipase-alpha isoform X1 n=1 Tax=Phlebotomus papatasi TaxID=29031 RepID=UPI0024833020|nr:diacylglycerol lipase-alpha isoform X1 [Phlebotomus papatasi]XP_055709574.1 diacylglycerol lipase-alpha isoform X1 [Phlebotomus papatasi]
MPGIVVFKRRWSVGSDDLVVPGVFLVTIHTIWIFILALVLGLIEYDNSVRCIELMWLYKIGYVVVLIVSLLVEVTICVISMRGSILETSLRTSMNYWVYLKLLVILIEIAWLAMGIVWLKEFYMDCPIAEAKEVMFGLIVCNFVVVFVIIGTIWCTFDTAGRSWVKMKKYQRSMKESESRFNYRRSGSRNRNWRQRKVIRAYQDSWDHRCRLLFCCMGSSERNRNSFTDIARLLSDFFRDLDVVPSDVVAGLVLLRKFQKLEREAIVRQRKNGTFEFLSGAAITEKTQFLALNDSRDYEYFQTVIHYMYYAQSAYGWPMYVMAHSATGLCQLCSSLICCMACCRPQDPAEIISDNCCHCNYAALRKMTPSAEIDVIYVTYHVDVGETPFFVAIDYTKQKVVISIRGTLSMKDILTDLNAEAECLPLHPPREDWLGHKGMVQAAVYIKQKLDEKNLIQKALHHNPQRNTPSFGLVIVGHSLGGGTAAILAILLKNDYPSLQCFSYSPPGGLLSMPAVEYSKSFITSVVVGKDVVPRIGLHQMEALRADLINAIKRSIDPKWKTIACSVFCCGCGPEPTSVSQMSSRDDNINAYEEQRTSARNTSAHPNDSSIALTLHRPMYPPGRIIHIVRHHPTPDEHKYEKGWRQLLKKREPVYQAIWAKNTDFDEVLISPVMFKDHMPDKVLAALNKVVTSHGPRKPQRQHSNINPSTAAMDIPDGNHYNHRPQSPVSHKVCLETSFTSLQSPADAPPSSKGSSLAGSFLGRSLDASSLLEDSGLVRSMSGPASEATTVLLAEPRKNVAFDTTKQGSAPSPAPTVLAFPRGILQKPGLPRKPVSLSFTEGRRTPSDVVKKIDLIHDDWFGLAPLASPESLSEVSSISSRASLAASLATSIEKCLGGIIQTQKDEPLIVEEMHTPRIMRRAPKITGNLSTCADDWKNVEQYKRMGQVFVTFPRLPSTNTSSSSDDQTFGSVDSANGLGHLNFAPPGGTIINHESSKSADNIDDNGGEMMNTAKLTMSDSAILDTPGKSVPANQSITQYQRVVTASSSDTFHSAMSSLSALEPVKLRSGVLESHFPVFAECPETSDQTQLLMDSPRRKSPSRIMCKKRNTPNDKIFAKNESLPLLANLVEKSSPTKFVKRKACVYPMSSSPHKGFPSIWSMMDFRRKQI